jgi:D-alanine-D-alanine ligase
MDKVRTKLVYRALGLPTPGSVSIAVYDDVTAKLDQVEADFGFPCVAKPSCDGSSFGVSFPKDRAQLEQSVRGHLEAKNEVLVEQFVKGQELTCGVLEEGDRTFALPVTEIVPGEAYEFFDYEAKYKPGATDEITPARIDDGLKEEVQRLAVAAHRALGCRDFSRTDFLVQPGSGSGSGALILETNTIPGLTAQSLLPQAAAVAGIDFPSLIDLLLTNARGRA